MQNDPATGENGKNEKAPSRGTLWAMANRERLNAESRAKYKKDKAPFLKRIAKWESKNKTKRRAMTYDWQKRNPKAYSLNYYKSGARNRGIEFCITREQFESMWNKDCHYCGSYITTIGIDRINNSRGYHIENIVACCTLCNMMKKTLPVEKFIAHARLIAVNSSRNGLPSRTPSNENNEVMEK